MHACGGRRGEREWRRLAPRRSTGWGLLLEGYLSLAGGNLRGGLRGRISIEIYQLSRYVLSGLCSPLIDWLIVDAAGPEAAMVSLIWFGSFSGPRAEIQLKPRCYLQGVKVQGLNPVIRDMLGEEMLP